MGAVKSKKILMQLPFKGVTFRQDFVACDNRKSYRRQQGDNAIDDFGKVRVFKETDLVEVDCSILTGKEK